MFKQGFALVYYGPGEFPGSPYTHPHGDWDGEGTGRLRVGLGIDPLEFGDLTISWGGFRGRRLAMSSTTISVIPFALPGEFPREGLLKHLAIMVPYH